MPKGMVKHRKKEESEARKGSLIGECIEAGLMAGLKSIDPDLVEKIADWAKKTTPTVVREESVHIRPAAQENRRCCLFCRHIIPSQISEFFGPYCGITGQEIIGEPRATCCGRFEPTTEKEGDTNE